MKKHLIIIAALAFALASCDNSFDLGKIDNEIDLVPGATIPFPKDTEMHIKKSSKEIIGITGPVISEVSGEEAISAGDLEAGFTLSKPISISMDSAPESLKSKKSKIKFKNADLTIAILNPADYPVKVVGEVVIDDKTFPISFDLGVSKEKQAVVIKFDDSVERISDVILVKNLKFTKASTKAAAPTADQNLVFKWDMVTTFNPEFKAGSVLVFEYAFEDLAFDLADLSVDVKAIDVKAKVSSTFPVSLTGNAVSNGSGISATLSKINANAVNQDVVLHASASKSVNTLRDVKIEITAVNESSSDVRIDGNCSLSLDLESIVLPEGIKL